MLLVTRFQHALTGFLSWLTMSPTAGFGPQSAQHPLGVSTPIVHALSSGAPVFRPPAANPGDPDFVCDYSAMKGWFPCSNSENRECWLRDRDGQEFNLHTDYEKFAPVGVTRHYVLHVTEGSINADGQPFDNAKLFNGVYPGPWLEACWGDVSLRVHAS